MSQKKKIVYIAMSADLLHPGHLNIIEVGAKYGDVVIGLLTDEAIASYKRIPFMAYEQRKRVIGEVRKVKKVVPQTTLSYKENLEKLKPDYVVHGDDWRQGVQKKTRAEVVRILKKWGGKLIEPKYTKNISSTQFNAALKEIGITPQDRIKRLRRLLSVKPLVRGIEVHNGLTGLIVENVAIKKNGILKEFDFMWLSSLTDSTAKGKPDIEVVDSTSRFNTLHDIFEVTTKPIIYDGDTGGLTEKFPYLVRTLERLGVSAVIIEDKNGLKQNSLLGASKKQGQETIEDFSEKIKKGKHSQVTEDFMIIARIESLVLGNGLEDALKRAKAYISAGADGIMIHSKDKDPKTILSFCRIYQKFSDKVPLVVVPTTYSSITEKQLEKAGAKIVIYANHLLRTAYPAMVKTAESILLKGSGHEAVKKYCMPLSDFLHLIKTEKYDTRTKNISNTQ